MKKLLILALLAMVIPTTAMAMKGMEHQGDDNKMASGGMAMDGVVMLQEEVVDGVKAAAHLMDGKNGMGKMLMVMFTDAKTGAMISEGRCAVKVETPDEKVGAAQKMMKSKGMFGTAVSFDQPGVYHFKIGTKLADGKKRTFHFHHEN